MPGDELNRAEVFLSSEQILQRVEVLGEIISQDYRGVDELVIVSVLRGSVYFTVDLSRRISIPLVLDFIGISSYGASNYPLGNVRITKDLDIDISQKHVLLIEDIVDTGLTLNYLLKNLRMRNPQSLRVCTFLDQPGRRIVEVPVDYKGFEIPDIVPVGYGVDYHGRCRNLMSVAAVKKERS